MLHVAADVSIRYRRLQCFMRLGCSEGGEGLAVKFCEKKASPFNAFLSVVNWFSGCIWRFPVHPDSRFQRLKVTCQKTAYKSKW